EGEREGLVESMNRSEIAFGLGMAETLRKRATQAVALIGKYDQGGTCHAVLKSLRNLRNERLAHRQVTSTPVEVRAEDASEKEIEAFYQDMSELIKHLLSVVLRTSYDTADTADVFQFHAKFFWASVRGERTEGHPNYRPLPPPITAGSTDPHPSK